MLLNSDEMNSLIIRMWPDSDLRTIAEILRISPNAVSNRAMKLGLPKKRRGKPSGWDSSGKEGDYQLSYLELAPGHFAVDDFSYRRIHAAR